MKYIFTLIVLTFEKLKLIFKKAIELLKIVKSVLDLVS